MRARGGTYVITGATSGIGLETARRLAATVDRLVVQGPEPDAVARAAVARISGGGGADVAYVSCDFSRLQDVLAGASALAEAAGAPVDGLVNNAGIPGADVRRMTADGHERTLQVNFLAMVLLTEQLRARLAPDARIVNLGSATHELATLDLPDIELTRGYSALRAYARSKLAIIMYTRWLNARLPEEVTAVSLSPGVIDTDLLHAMFGAMGGSVEHGAENVLAALAAQASGGEYYDDGRLVDPSAEARDDRAAEALMAWTYGTLGRLLPEASARPA